MAGMFSLLNNNLRTEGGQTLPINSSRDDGNSGKNPTPGSRTPVMNRRKFPSDRNAIKYSMGGGDKLPKSMRKRRIEELHPIMRRSVCTLIIAAIVMATGVVLTFVDLFCLHYVISVRGLILLIGGFALVTVGLIWFKCSQKKLDILKEKVEQAKIKKMKLQSVSPFEVLETTVIPIIQSKHATKWPSRMDCPGDNCSEIITSPNGNHIMSNELHHSCSCSDEENCSISYPVPANDFPFQKHCEVNGNTLHQNLECPARIDKNGKLMDVASDEQCGSCVMFSNSENDLQKNIKFISTSALLSC